MSKTNKVTLFRVPGHREIEKNEEANILAEIGAKTPFTGSELF